MQHSAIAAKEESMTTLHRGQVLRQYCNKRTRTKETEICTSPKGMDKEKDLSSVFTSPVQVKDSHPTVTSELKPLSDSKLSTSQPQVIVRKFTLPPSSSSYSLPIKPKKNTDFGKPKQRWKQLCNLQHEMTTTLGISRVQMLSPSAPLTQEYCPGTLQSYAAGTLDIMDSTLQKLLTSKEVDVDSSIQSKEENCVPCVSSPVASSDDTVDSAADYVDVNEILDTAEEVPEIAAVAEVSSTGGTVSFGPFDTTYSNIGIVGGKLAIFQPLPGTKHIFQEEGGNPKVNTIVLKSPQGAAVEALRGKKVIKPFMSQMEEARSLLRMKLMQGNVKTCSEFATKEHGVGHKHLKHPFEPVMKEQNVVSGNRKHNSPSVIKEQNVIWANQKHKPEPSTKQQSVIQGDVKHASELYKNERNIKCGNLKNDTQPGSKNEQNVKHGNSRNDTDPASTEQNITDENLKHDDEPSSKDQNVSHRNLKNVSEPTSKEQNVAVHSVPQEAQCLKVAHDCLQDVLTKSPQTAALVAARQSSVQSKNSQSIKPSHNPTEDASAEWKQMEQLYLEIMKMKRRWNIAMKVERDVLRAKDIKLVQEVLLPARKVLLSEVGTQTNLFSLVESGRMVEMKISTDKNEDLGEMVSSGTKCVAEENIAVMQKPCGYVLNSGTPPAIIVSGCGKKLMARTGGIDEKVFEKNVSLSGGMTTASDEPDKKKVRLDVTLKSQNDPGGSVTSDMQATQSSSGTVSFDSGNNATNMEIQDPSQRSKSDVILLNSSIRTSEAEILHNLNVLRNTNIAVSGLPGVTNNPASSKPVKCGTNISSEKNRKSIYDIIVEHNIAAQVRKSPPKQKTMMEGIGGNENKSAAMVYFPDSDLLNKPRNTKSSEVAAKITDALVRQAFEDWARCGIPDESGNIPLHRAVINENITLVKRQCVVLCARKSKLDVYNLDKETPLHLAVLNGNAEIVRMLISFGAQSSVKDRNGNTALHLAVLHGNLDCVKAILNTNSTKSLPLDDINDEGYSPVHLCALNGKVEEMKCLIIKGAQVNLKDAKSGRTPLFHAVEANNCDLVQFLLANDANPNAANFSGHTPLSAAGEISFTSGNTTGEYSISDGINFSSKLVPLSRGSSVTQTLDEGSSIVFGGELLEDVCVDEVHENDCSSATMNGSSNSSSNIPWFLNE